MSSKEAWRLRRQEISGLMQSDVITAELRNVELMIVESCDLDHSIPAAYCDQQ